MRNIEEEESGGETCDDSRENVDNHKNQNATSSINHDTRIIESFHSEMDDRRALLHDLPLEQLDALLFLTKNPQLSFIMNNLGATINNISGQLSVVNTSLSTLKSDFTSLKGRVEQLIPPMMHGGVFENDDNSSKLMNALATYNTATGNFPIVCIDIRSINTEQPKIVVGLPLKTISSLIQNMYDHKINVPSLYVLCQRMGAMSKVHSKTRSMLTMLLPQKTSSKDTKNIVVFTFTVNSDISQHQTT